MASDSVLIGVPSTVQAWRDRLTVHDTRAGAMAVLDTGTGTPVILLHGIPTHSYLWNDVAAVVSRGQRAIAPDLIGFGHSVGSDEADLSPNGQADAIEDVLAALDIEQFTLVGHDYGALVACELLRRHQGRVDALVLTNTSLRKDDWTGTSAFNPLALLKVPLVGEAALKAAHPAMLKQAFALYVSERDRLDAMTMEQYWFPFRNGLDQTLLRLARAPGLTEETVHAWKAALYDYQGPALVVWGANDPSFRPDRAHEIVQLLHHCRFELFINSNHFVPIDRPLALGRLISAFVEGKLEVL